jgi:hypothetical protein
MAGLAVPTFSFGGGAQARTPQEAARLRETTAALMARLQTPQNVGQGLGAIGNALVVRALNDRATAGEEAGQAHAADLLKTLQGGDPSQADLIGAVSDPWVASNPGESAVAQTLLQRGMQQSDPAYGLDMQYKQAQIDALKAKPAVTPTDDMRELSQINTERAAAGKPPLSMEDFLASKKGQGLEVVTNPDGTTTVTMGGSGKPLTEAQGKDVYYINQGTAALPALDQMGDSLTKLDEGAALGGTPLIGNYLKSSDYQQAEQAGRQFLNAILRKESGAAISETEDARYGNAYLPRPGDKAPVLAQKKAARANALLGIKMGLPAGAILAMTQAGVDFGALAKEATAPTGDPTTAAPAVVPTPGGAGPAPGAIEDGYRFKGGDPSDPKNWEAVT